MDSHIFKYIVHLYSVCIDKIVWFAWAVPMSCQRQNQQTETKKPTKQKHLIDSIVNWTIS